MAFALRYLGHRSGASLTHFTGAGVTQKVGDVFEIPAEGATIGRRGGVGLRIGSSNVGGMHARLSIADGRPCIEDLRSTNGTCVNDERLGTGIRALAVGDRVTFDDAFDFEVIDQAAMSS